MKLERVAPGKGYSNRRCINCWRKDIPKGEMVHERCHPCYWYKKRNGYERPYRLYKRDTKAERRPDE